MISSITPGISVPSAIPAGEGKGAGAAGEDRSEIGKRFEQMLWAEMLSHAGLEKSLTLGGGEAASAFSRYVVESIAEDLAETHPLGFARRVDDVAASQPAAQAAVKSAP
ncbi:hypothetical protein HNE_0262 [Hyphomonas neptunium ATCC 15444]|uniref:Flagellar protein FlgJ N-terminal domain-containing protein n=2 Tax=Hyphomonas TaxID=85 RepID=Q0C5K0_HYPNA|nr:MULTISPECIES: hypothetical protein [Hyphomonas]ABI78061.1 hypothetical protein HNE_0262 [Hyphomonas neptunium ATCC 15444]KCZ95421.1 hypothetical protein HHI_04675 [Hyphomonas hirschiana VP5]